MESKITVFLSFALVVSISASPYFWDTKPNPLSVVSSGPKGINASTTSSSDSSTKSSSLSTENPTGSTNSSLETINPNNTNQGSPNSSSSLSTDQTPTSNPNLAASGFDGALNSTMFGISTTDNSSQGSVSSSDGSISSESVTSTAEGSSASRLSTTDDSLQGSTPENTNQSTSPVISSLQSNVSSSIPSSVNISAFSDPGNSNSRPPSQSSTNINSPVVGIANSNSYSQQRRSKLYKKMSDQNQTLQEDGKHHYGAKYYYERVKQRFHKNGKHHQDKSNGTDQQNVQLGTQH